MSFSVYYKLKSPSGDLGARQFEKTETERRNSEPNLMYIYRSFTLGLSPDRPKGLYNK